MNDDGQLLRMLGAHRDVVTGGSPSGHFDVDVLSRHASGQLSGPRARAVSEHLLICEDGRCVAFVRSNAEDLDAAAAVLYPAVEAEMHARTFLCREALWQTFEEIAREQGAPIDDVLSEAMRSYARQRSYGTEAQSASNPNMAYGPSGGGDPYDSEHGDLARTGALRPPTQRLQPPARGAPMPAPGRSGVGMPPPPPMSSRGMPPPQQQQRPYTQPIGQMPPPPQRARPMAGAPPPMRAAMPQSPRSVPPPPRSVPPPLPPSDPMVGGGYGAPRGRTAAQQLTLSYNGRHVDVAKERFVLGRSKTQADLVLEDPNVSRQHAAIERVGNDWVLVDLGSTNGCYIDGQRVSRRNIADGDVIEITTHQVHCTLR